MMEQKKVLVLIYTLGINKGGKITTKKSRVFFLFFKRIKTSLK